MAKENPELSANHRQLATSLSLRVLSGSLGGSGCMGIRLDDNR
jgi:hypothetical protein